MSNEEFFKKKEEERAAHMLLVEFIKNHPDVVADALQPIIAIWGEVSYESLKNDVGVVSQVFAGLALKLIDHNSSLSPEDSDNMVLPVGARTMSSTIESLAKFIDSTRSLWLFLIDKHIENPAVRMVHETFMKYEAQM